jgi:hypothetical protein
VSTVELLDPERHARLRLRPPQQELSHFVPVFANEFAAAAACSPILFTKDAGTGRFYAGAVLGFEPGENLVGGADEPGGFDPLSRRREGFFVSGANIAIDPACPRFSEHDGEPLFDEARQPAAALRAMQRTLGEIHNGLERSNAFITAMTDHRLVEPIDVSLSFDDGRRVSLQGLYAVSLDRLREIDDATALRFFRDGTLQLAYTMVASLRQIRRLAALGNRRRGKGAR